MGVESPKREKHRAILILIPLAVSAFLRLFPSLLDGAPFGTDGWDLIRISNVLLAHTPVALTGGSLFGFYDIYWPGAALFGSVSSLILNLPPIIVMPVVIPLAASLTALFLFVIVEKLTKNSTIACIASLFFTTASFDSIFTASVTKETYAEPLFMAGILLAFLLLFSKGSKTDPKGAAIFAVIVVGLTISHHGTALIFALIVLALSLSRAVIGFGGGRFGFTSSFEGSPFNIITLPAISWGIVGFYLLDYAAIALPFQVTMNEIIYATAFLVLSGAGAIYFILERKFRKINFMMLAALYLVAISLFILSEFTHIFPLVPVLPQSIAFDALPYLILGIILLVGYSVAEQKLLRPSFSFLAIWASVPIALFGFVAFALPDEGVFLYRLFTFLYAPFSIIAAVAFIPLFASKIALKSKIKWNLARAGALILIVAIVLLSSFQSYSAVVQNQNLLGGEWAYKPSDVSSAIWTDKNIASNTTIAGDTKIYYLFGEYFGLNVSPQLGYDELTAGLGAASSSPLVISRTMYQNGYNLLLYGEPLPSGWQVSLANSSSLIYDNGNDQIWD